MISRENVETRANERTQGTHMHAMLHSDIVNDSFWKKSFEMIYLCANTFLQKKIIFG